VPVVSNAKPYTWAIALTKHLFLLSAKENTNLFTAFMSLNMHSRLFKVSIRNTVKYEVC